MTADHASPPAIPPSSRPAAEQGLSLAPVRGLRPAVGDDRTGSLLCPPYDVIGPAERRELLDGDPDNIVSVILPDPTPAGYDDAAQRLRALEADGVYALDAEPAVYVYEMATAQGHVTRGLLGSVALRDPADGVILPHENTMAGPVADRLAVMTATGCDLEPIYLVYDGGGEASRIVRETGDGEPVATARTPDGIVHRLWAVTDRDRLTAIAADLADRHALIADGHHRYATYRERQRRSRDDSGDGPWDRGLALLVDSSDYGPQVHAIHRVLPGFALGDAVARLDGWATVTEVDPAETAEALARSTGFAVVLTDGSSAYLVTDDGDSGVTDGATSGSIDTDTAAAGTAASGTGTSTESTGAGSAGGRLAGAAAKAGGDPSLAALDVSVVHSGLVRSAWGLTDDERTVGYAHDVTEAVDRARETGGTAVLLRPTPVAAVAAVAAAGARMPRKSTLFTPKPASGLVLRRLADEVEH